MALTARIALHGGDGHAPEDYLSSALGVLFPDDVTNQHGDGCAAEDLAYTSPHLPLPLRLRLGRPTGEHQRRLFSHHLWNAALLVAEMLEADGLRRGGPLDVRGKQVLEVGAGAGLPSVMAGFMGARKVVATDYPAEGLLDALADNLAHNIDSAHAPEQTRGIITAPCNVLARGHTWGAVPDDTSHENPSAEDAFAATHRHAFDLVLTADCLWMPWQHGALLRSLEHFLRRGSEPRAWVVAGFHTGRTVLAGFLGMLRDGSLEVERVWERDCEGEDISARKRWLVVVVVRRRGGRRRRLGERELSRWVGSCRCWSL